MNTALGSSYLSEKLVSTPTGCCNHPTPSDLSPYPEAPPSLDSTSASSRRPSPLIAIISVLASSDAALF